MNHKKYDVIPNLKTVLNEGKKSTFSLTSLFDSNNFTREEEKNVQNDLNKDDQHLVDDEEKTEFDNPRKRKLNDESKDESKDESEEEFDEMKGYNSQIKYERIKERFFFEVNDERFERFKFYDANRIERHNREWDKKKQQLTQAFSRRRRSMKKKTSNETKFKKTPDSHSKYRNPKISQDKSHKSAT